MTTLLQQAIDNLNIQDVYLTHSNAYIHDGTNAKYDDFSVFQTQVRTDNPTYDVVVFENEKKILRVRCYYGVRWVSQAEQELVQRAVIEASFVAEYIVNDGLGEEAIEEFIKRNVHHHVWPYWREFLASHTERMRLPRTVVHMIQFANKEKNASEK